MRRQKYRRAGSEKEKTPFLSIAFYNSISSGQSGIAHLAHLGGMIFGYLYLRTGNPWATFKNYLDRRRLNRLKRRFHIVPGGKDDDSGPTVH